jgi:hypothetical protein
MTDVHKWADAYCLQERKLCSNCSRLVSSRRMALYGTWALPCLCVCPGLRASRADPGWLDEMQMICGPRSAGRQQRTHWFFFFFNLLFCAVTFWDPMWNCRHYCNLKMKKLRLWGILRLAEVMQSRQNATSSKPRTSVPVTDES